MTSLPLQAFIEADIHLLTPQAGGRGSPIASGYRCTCWIGHVDQGGKRTFNDASLYLVDVERLAPGATARAQVRPHSPEYWSDLAVGTRFELCEGTRVIGEAVVVALFPSA